MTRVSEQEYIVLSMLQPGEAVAVDELRERISQALKKRDDGTRDIKLPPVRLQVDRGIYGLPESPCSDQSYVMVGVKLLADKGLLEVTGVADEEVSLVADGGLQAEKSGLPEREALVAIKNAGGAVAMAELPKLLGRDDTRAEVKWLLRKGWCSREAGLLVITDKGRGALGVEQGPDELLVWKLRHERRSYLTSEVSDMDVREALNLLRGRDDIVRIKKRTRRTLLLTDAGERLRAEGIEPIIEVTQLTPELLAAKDHTRSWRNVTLRRYDVTLGTAPRYPGKAHPLQRAVQETRRAFLEMGFEEAESPVIETSFWDFDALFQPQDHPTREMQDTFYMAAPKTGRLPDEELVERIRRTHENGGDTGSTGWGGKWERAATEKVVLRTHTTATTIRALAANPNPPRKVFSVGKVFRRENVDATHLPEFMQIDGIIIDEQANLATLFGTLREFYLKMGAKDVRFRPSFFPYTEPSAEAFAYLEGLGWVEMCGAGVFRPEVTRPLGCRVPVIAWGGGLERVAMMRFGLNDIRKLYWADIDWLRKAALWR